MPAQRTQPYGSAQIRLPKARHRIFCRQQFFGRMAHSLWLCAFCALAFCLSLWVQNPTNAHAAYAQTKIQAGHANIRGSLEGSLSRAVGKKHGRPLAAQAVRLLQWNAHIPKDVRRNDKIWFAYTLVEGQAGLQPQLQALVYRGERIDLAAYGFANSNQIVRYYNASGWQIEPSLKDTPLPDAWQITEQVQRGPGRRRHDGLDLKAPTGTPIRAPRTGKISRINWHRRVNGNCVELIDAQGMRHRFLHLHHVDKSLRRGKMLAKYAQMGTVGSTGRSGAPHLHYEIRDKKGRVRNPLKVLGSKKARLDQSRQHAFAQKKQSLRQAMGLKTLLPANLVRHDAPHSDSPSASRPKPTRGQQLN